MFKSIDWGAVWAAIFAGIAAFQSWRTSREVQPPKPKRRRTLRRVDEEPSTLGEKVEAIANDMSSMKEQQGENWRALTNHIADKRIHGGNEG